MKKLVLAIIVSAVVMSLLFSSFAAPTLQLLAVDEGGGLLSGIWDSMGFNIQWLWDGICGGFNSVIESIDSSIHSIGAFFADLGKTIMSAVTSMLEGLYRLFVPSSDYFPRLTKSFQETLTRKFGNILYLSSYLGKRFSSIGKVNTQKMFVINLSSTDISPRFSFNLLEYIYQYLPIIRGALTGFVTLMSVALCYKKAKELINS